MVEETRFHNSLNDLHSQATLSDRILIYSCKHVELLLQAIYPKKAHEIQMISLT